MKSSLYFILTLALANNWQKSPIKIEHNLVTLNLTDVSCSNVSNWLANASNTNISIAQNNQKISLNWQNIPLEKAWQELNKICNYRTLRSYKTFDSENISQQIQTLINKPSKLLLNADKVILWGTYDEHNALAQLIPKNREMLAIQLKWLIMDEQAENSLGLDLGNINIEPKTLLPSARLWHLAKSLKDWQLILNAILNDLKKSQHLLSISEPYLIVSPNSTTSLESNILVPNIIKTSRSSYSSMQNLPIDLTINCSPIYNNFVQININSHMHATWDNPKWPKAIHSLKSKVRLKLNSNLIIAKQKLIIANEQRNKYNWFSLLRNNQNNTTHTLNLYVLISANTISKKKLSF